MTKIPAEYLREKIDLSGWGTIKPAPAPIRDIGDPARLTTDEVVDHRKAEIELLKEAARLVSINKDHAATFERFLIEFDDVE